LRYVHLLWIQFRASAAGAMQYRFEFWFEGLLGLFWTATALLPLWVLLGQRHSVAGWTLPEALVVVGWFTVMRGILEGAVSPALLNVVEHIRKGTLDFVLLKPADAQFLVSTAKFEPWRAIDLLSSLAIFGVAFGALHRAPAPAHVLAALVLLVGAAVVLYSLSILVVSAAFYVVRIDNLSFLFQSVFEAARWPASVFHGFWSVVFTFIIPLALMTTYPALALLGRLDARTAALVLLGAAAFGGVARWVWLRSIARYTSASS
jgi:ABC-2 type transport system permease protein